MADLKERSIQMIANAKESLYNCDHNFNMEYKENVKTKTSKSNVERFEQYQIH